MTQTQSSKNLLDSRSEIAKLDKSNALGSVEALADQVKQAWEETQKIEFIATSEIKNIVICGMGGSALGGDVIKHLYKDLLDVPIDVNRSYSLPNYVDKHTLILLSSYSGSTEETLSCAKQAQEKNAQIIVITSGKNLQKLAKKNNYPIYVIHPKHNPSGQPRMAIGYAIAGIIGLLNKTGLLNIQDHEMEEVVTTIIAESKKCGVKVASANNKAKSLAFTCMLKRPVLVASEFLEGAVHCSSNQFNENAKIYADYKVVPEINHHLLEALRFPVDNVVDYIFLFFKSNLYHPRNRKRIKITQEIIENSQMEALGVNLTSETKLTQVFELITLMAFVNFYLSMLEGIDPSPVPYVDLFKKKMKETTPA